MDAYNAVMKIYAVHAIQGMSYHQSPDYVIPALPIAINAKKISHASHAIQLHYYRVDHVLAVLSDARCAHPRVFAPHAKRIITWFRMDANLALLDVLLALFRLDILAPLALMGIF